MTDPLEPTGGSDTPAESAVTPQNTPADPHPAQSGEVYSNDQIKALKGKAGATARSRFANELKEKYAVSSIEELDAIVASHRQGEEAAAIAAEAERNEKEELSRQLVDARNQLKLLERRSVELDDLRGRMINERIARAGLEAGVLPNATEEFISFASRYVRWNEDFTDVVVSKIADPDEHHESIADFATEAKEHKDFLFPAKRANGTGFVPERSQRQQSGQRSHVPSIRERAEWGRRR